MCIYSIRGGDGGCWAINIWPGGRSGGAHRSNSPTFLGSWAKLAVHSCGTSATMVMATLTPHLPLPPVVQQLPMVSFVAQQPLRALPTAQQPPMPSSTSPSIPVAAPAATQPVLDILITLHPPPALTPAAATQPPPVSCVATQLPVDATCGCP